MAEPPVDVSVIVAVRNGVATLAQCIDSVLEQTGCTVELLIVDAMSDDGTKEIVESYSNRIATSAWHRPWTPRKRQYVRPRPNGASGWARVAASQTNQRLSGWSTGSQK